MLGKHSCACAVNKCIAQEAHAHNDGTSEYAAFSGTNCGRCKTSNKGVISCQNTQIDYSATSNPANCADEPTNCESVNYDFGVKGWFVQDRATCCVVQ